eukprot:m.83867 g.83867  ORF g.83867 m.83867 type:complete len:474 (+) comp25681_c0_seq1:447-1868(+)
MPPKEVKVAPKELKATKSFRARWGHRRTSSQPVNVMDRGTPPPSSVVAPTLTAAAAAISPSNRPVKSPLAAPTLEEERDGLTAMTMISATDKAGREVKYSNAGLPTMHYENTPARSLSDNSPTKRKLRKQRSGSEFAIVIPDPILENEPKCHLKRTSSDPGLDHVAKTSESETKQILAYWKIEKELRVAQDALEKKSEEMKDMEVYKANLTREMDDLTSTLFEEAHEMVRIEKEARHKDNILLKETNDKSTVLQEELKALKLIVAAQQPLRGKHGKSSSKSSNKQETNSDQDTAIENAVDPTWPVDTMLFNEFMKWHITPSLEEDTTFMRRVITEDIRPCLRFHSKTSAQSIALLKVIKDNNLIIEEIQGAKEELCSLSLHKRTCGFRLKSVEKVLDKDSDSTVCALVGEKEWLHISGPVRNRVICVCNYYTYVRYVVQGIVKATIPEIYWRLVDLRLQINKARLGFPVNGGR